jgi:hypothetical protein
MEDHLSRTLEDLRKRRTAIDIAIEAILALSGPKPVPENEAPTVVPPEPKEPNAEPRPQRKAHRFYVTQKEIWDTLKDGAKILTTYALRNKLLADRGISVSEEVPKTQLLKMKAIRHVDEPTPGCWCLSKRGQ